MKITKRQLKRIIREEKSKLIRENDWHADGGASNRADADLEAAVYGMLGSLVEQNGLSDEEAAQQVLSIVRNILGL